MATRRVSACVAMNSGESVSPAAATATGAGRRCPRRLTRRVSYATMPAVRRRRTPQRQATLGDVEGLGLGRAGAGGYTAMPGPRSPAGTGRRRGCCPGCHPSWPTGPNTHSRLVGRGLNRRPGTPQGVPPPPSLISQLRSEVLPRRHPTAIAAQERPEPPVHDPLFGSGTVWRRCSSWRSAAGSMAVVDEALSELTTFVSDRPTDRPTAGRSVPQRCRDWRPGVSGTLSAARSHRAVLSGGRRQRMSLGACSLRHPRSASMLSGRAPVGTGSRSAAARAVTSRPVRVAMSVMGTWKVRNGPSGGGFPALAAAANTVGRSCTRGSGRGRTRWPRGRRRRGRRRP